MKEPRWVDRRAILLLHAATLAEHGGSPGIRDEGLLDAALGRPQNRFAYGREVDIPVLAAAYGFGLARNHPFIDGNKRIAFIATSLFLRLNRHRLVAERADEVRAMLELSAGRLSEKAFAKWIRKHCVKSE